MSTKYAERIVEIYNEHAAQYRFAYQRQDFVEEGVHAFICDAIARAVTQRGRIPNDPHTHNLRKYFYEHVYAAEPPACPDIDDDEAVDQLLAQVRQFGKPA